MAPDIRRPLRKLLPILLKAQKDNLNEADTVARLVVFFEEALGYDRLEEITREAQVRDKFVDIAVRVDGAVKFLVEAKAAGTDLRNRHIEQAKGYAAEANIRWVLLTNGVIWSLYHLTFEEGVEYERLFTVDLSVDEVEAAAEKLALLHRRSVARDKHEDYWHKHAALDAASVAKALYAENVLRLMRRDIRRREGILVDEEDLANAIHALFSTEAREKIGPVRIRRRRAAKPTGVDSASVDATAGQAPAAPSAALPPKPYRYASNGNCRRIAVGPPLDPTATSAIPFVFSGRPGAPRQNSNPPRTRRPPRLIHHNSRPICHIPPHSPTFLHFHSIPATHSAPTTKESSRRPSRRS